MERRDFLESLIGGAVVGVVADKPQKPKSTEDGRKLPNIGHAIEGLKPIRTPKIRIWNLGSLEHRILPSQEAIDRLVTLLQAWQPGEDLDLVWGPELTMTQYDCGPGDIDIIKRIILPKEVEGDKS